MNYKQRMLQRAKESENDGHEHVYVKILNEDVCRVCARSKQ